jgi:hypothetical protein
MPNTVEETAEKKAALKQHHPREYFTTTKYCMYCMVFSIIAL